MENIQFLTISLDQFHTMPADRDRRRGLSRALYEEFRARIADGTYAAGAPLPSSRALAAERGLSRGTVTLVYEQLAADGFIDTRPGAMSRVAEGAAFLSLVNYMITRDVIGLALAEYREHLLRVRGVADKTARHVERTLRRFLPVTACLSTITPEGAARLYQDETRRISRRGTPVAADSHRLLLSRARAFFAWAGERRLVAGNPFAAVQPVGRRRSGKPQLRIDEARKFVATALGRARTLEVGATAALMQIFLGLRPTEAVIRVVRDLDDQGRVLWVPFGKTSNARRRLQVPEVLREILLQHAHGKPPESPLLGPAGEGMHTRHALRHRLRQLCAEAEVPQICPHSLRGLNATLALEAGATAHHVAAALGHASFATTARHYADASTVANASLRRVADLLGSEEQVSPDLLQLARLLREHLNAAQLQLLRDKLTGPDESR